MLAKIAEMAALRKAFPDAFSGIYNEAEMDRGEALDLSPSEMAEKADQDERMKLIGGAALTVDWLNCKELVRVPVGKFADAVMAFLDESADEPMTIQAFRDRNRHALQEFWALQKSDALVIKKRMEGLMAAPRQLENGAAHVQ